MDISKLIKALNDILSQGGFEKIKILPDDSLPSSNLINFSSEADDHTEHPVSYTLNGNFVFNYIAEFSDDTSFASLNDKINKMINLLHNAKNLTGFTRSPEIAFSGKTLEIFFEEDSKKTYGVFELSFDIQAFISG